MTPAEVAAKLRQFNEWRRGDYEPSEQPDPPNPYEVGLAIDAAVEMINRLEAAESEAIEQARLNDMGAERELALMAKIDRLRRALIVMTKGYNSVAYAQWPPEMHLANEVLEDTQ